MCFNISNFHNFNSLQCREVITALDLDVDYDFVAWPMKQAHQQMNIHEKNGFQINWPTGDWETSINHLANDNVLWSELKINFQDKGVFTPEF